MRILVVGTHPNVRQESMSLFANWLSAALAPLGDVDIVCADPIFLTKRRTHCRFAKWLAYIDQYVVLTLKLYWQSRQYDFVFVADHSNGPSTLLVQCKKLAVMVHDTIPLRQARGRALQAPRLGLSGLVLQRVTEMSLRRMRLIMSNPGAVPTQVVELGLATNPIVVGCPIDRDRLSKADISASLSERPYLLSVSSDGWRKRKPHLLAIWREVEARSDLRLVLAGFTGEETAKVVQKFGLKNVTIINDVSNTELAGLYTACSGVISLSLEEGLCIPVLEALAFDKQVFLPDVSPSYADFFGDAVTRIEMEDPAVAAEAILESLFSPPPQSPKVREILDWFSKDAFERRVRDAVQTMAPGASLDPKIELSTTVE